jgi:hypothetical protein
MALQPDTDLLVDDFTIAELQGDGSRYRVNAVALDNDNITGDLLGDRVEATWHPVGQPGSFTSSVRWSREWDTELAATIAYEYEQVQAIYALAV